MQRYALLQQFKQLALNDCSGRYTKMTDRYRMYSYQSDVSCMRPEYLELLVSRIMPSANTREQSLPTSLATTLTGSPAMGFQRGRSVAYSLWCSKLTITGLKTSCRR